MNGVTKERIRRIEKIFNTLKKLGKTPYDKNEFAWKIAEEFGCEIKRAREYFKVVAEDNELSDDLLNQSLPKEYENLYKTVKEEMETERLKKKWEKEINKVLAWTRVVGELQKV